MTFKRTTKIILIVFLACILMFMPLLITNNSSIQTQNNINNTSLEVNSKANIRQYTTDEGELRTIYWAQGIDAPIMDSDSNLVGKDNNYFEKVEDKETTSEGTFTQRYYQSAVNITKGYSDINKNPNRMAYQPGQDGPHCYLATAGNLLNWWFTQNKSYIDRYVDLLLNSDTYQQPSGLKPIKDKALWDNLRQPISLTNVPMGGNNIELQLLRDTPIIKTALQVYLDRYDDGFFTDRVLDFFINGYTSLGVFDENRETNYNMDSKGGFFYPVFAHQRLTKRYQDNVGDRKFDNVEKVIKDAFSSGKMVAMSYLFAGGNNAHAITIWGAEYDEEGHIVRIYVSDSDDQYNWMIRTPNVARSMYTMDLHKDTEGLVRFTSRVNPDINYGTLIHGLVTFDLAQDIWEAKLADMGEPQAPVLSKPILDKGFSPQAKDTTPIEVLLDVKDTGYYSYQWYENPNPNGGGQDQIIVNARSKSYKPPLPTINNPKYYKCVITNNIKGRQISTSSNYVKVFIDETLEDAVAPKITYNKLTFDYDQYADPIDIRVNISNRNQLKGTLSYQWYEKQSTNRAPNGGTLLEGETKPYYTPTRMHLFEDGTAYVYYCVVTHTDNSVAGEKVVTNIPTNGAILTVLREGTLQNAKRPIIVDEPKDTSFILGGSIPEFSVFAKSADGGTLSYQWFLNDVKVVGATNKTFTPNIKNAGTNYLYCEITNKNDLAISSKEAKIQTSRIAITSNSSEGKNNNANLKEIKVNGTNVLNFDKNVLNYIVNVDNIISQATIVATVEDTNKATYKVTGNKQLVEGDNIFTILVTAEDGKTTKSYSVNVKRAAYIASNNANLEYLRVKGYTLSPTFNENTLIYTLNVNHDITSIEIEAGVKDNKSSLIGTGVKSLVEGLNKFSVVVTAEDKKTTKTYEIHVTRASETLSQDVNLEYLRVKGYTLSPNFNENTLIYTLNVNHDITSIEIEAGVKDSKSSLTGAGEKSLIKGLNKFSVVVTAEDKRTTKTYEIHVTRASYIPSQDANLEYLQVKGYTLFPTFNENTLIYSLNVNYNITSIKIEAGVKDSKSSLTGIGVKNLVEGLNKFCVVVTAEDKQTTKTYEVHVTRAKYIPSSDNNLNSLSIKNHTIKPSFNTNILKYTLDVDYDVASIEIVADVKDSKSSLIGIGIKDLNVGLNTFNIVVTAENKEIKTYVIEVTRKEKPKSNINHLENITINGQSFNELFNKENLEYMVEVPSNVDKLDVQGIVPEGSGAQVTVEGGTNLVEGENIVSIVVTAENGDKRTYTVKVNKSPKAETIRPIIPSPDQNPDIEEGGTTKPPQINNNNKPEKEYDGKIVATILIIGIVITVIVIVVVLIIKKHRY